MATRSSLIIFALSCLLFAVVSINASPEIAELRFGGIGGSISDSHCYAVGCLLFEEDCTEAADCEGDPACEQTFGTAFNDNYICAGTYPGDTCVVDKDEHCYTIARYKKNPLAACDANEFCDPTHGTVIMACTSFIKGCKKCDD